jgi:rod shape determining protein RodA
MTNTKKPDLLYLFGLLSLIGIGVLLVYSATSDSNLDFYKTFWFRQIIFFGVGALLASALISINPRFFYTIAYPAYFLSLVALLYLAMGGGVETKGAGRWIAVGGVRLQPSEFAKLAFLLALSRMMTGKRLSLTNLRGFVAPGLLFLAPFVLILKQPDLSTALVFSALTIVFLFWAGLKISELFLLISPVLSVIGTSNQVFWAIFIAIVFFIGLRIRLPLKLFSLILLINITAPYASFTIWNSVLKDHQRERILTFVDPMQDPKGAGYQVIQSRLAIGSGGILGKGLGEGSQTNLNFLPEEHTDFIFSVLGEQFGFIGAVFVLMLYLLVIWRGFSIASIQENEFAGFIVVGASTILFFHVVVNVAMTLGMMPVTGLPLPFLSYGGSFVMTCMALVGLQLNMRLKAHKI